MSVKYLFHHLYPTHIAYSRKFRRCIADVRVMKGATVGSDHNLVVGKVKLKLKKNWKEKTKI